MKIAAKGLGAALALTLVAGTGFAAGHAMSVQKEREDLMKTMGQNLGTLGKMAKGEMDYDSAAAVEAAIAVHGAASASSVMALWPEGSGADADGESRALPDIWANYDDFQEKQAALVSASKGAITAAGESLQSLQASLGEIGGACGACHKVYRAPEE